MKNRIICFLLLVSASFVSAQETDLLNIDKEGIDSIFGELLTDEYGQEIQEQQEETQSFEHDSSILSDIRKRGVEFVGAFSFRGAINPGWNMLPWEFDGSQKFSWAIGIHMEGSVSINAQISESFRVLSVINFTIPSSSIFSLGDFFFDYNFLNYVFLRAGKYEHSWGISPNFAFTNLLTRVPVFSTDRNDRSGPSYIVKFDIPIGVGGLQLLAMTRVRIVDQILPELDDIGYGGKFNLAFNWADFNLGIYWQEGMALRAFLSVKTNLWKTDFYNEWLAAVNTHTDNAFSFAVNFGFVKSLFNNRFDINGEFFYNGEGRSAFYHRETDFTDEGTSNLPHGISFALNLLYRFKVRLDPRLFLRVRYSIDENSASIIPGIRLTPFSNLEVYFAVPVALGSKDGCYYRDSVNGHPFSFMLYITFSGSVRASRYF